MEELELQRVKSYIVDLTRTRGRGEFRCPKCGVEISPDNGTDDAYTILDTVMKGDNLDKIILRCNGCRSQLHLVGFYLLDNALKHLET